MQLKSIQEEKSNVKIDQKEGKDDSNGILIQSEQQVQSENNPVHDDQAPLFNEQNQEIINISDNIENLEVQSESENKHPAVSQLLLSRRPDWIKIAQHRKRLSCCWFKCKCNFAMISWNSLILITCISDIFLVAFCLGISIFTLIATIVNDASPMTLLLQIYIFLNLQILAISIFPLYL